MKERNEKIRFLMKELRPEIRAELEALKETLTTQQQDSLLTILAACEDYAVGMYWTGFNGK